jgi:hypothetical protein
MSDEQINIAIAEACGWRKWKFGDPWRKGLRLADQRFDGFIRRVIKDAPANSKTVSIDIEEIWTRDVSEIIANYVPVSHWVRKDEIRSSPPDYCNDLNAMREAEKVLKLGLRNTYDAELGLIAKRDYCFIWETTASQRAEAFLRTLGKWEVAK